MTAPGRSVAAGRPRSRQADQAILEAAAAVLVEEGYGALTMLAVATRAGVSTATLYRRWTSKAELVAVAVAADRPERPDIDTGSLAGDLSELLERAVDSLNGHSRPLLFAAAGELARHAELAAGLRDVLLEPAERQVRALLERAARRGEISAIVDPAPAMALVFGPLQYRALISGEAVDRAFTQRLVPLLLGALASAA